MQPVLIALIVVLWIWIALAGRKQPADAAPARRGVLGWEVLLLLALGVLYLLGIPRTPPM